MSLPLHAALGIAVVGAGPVGLALALHAARQLPAARVTLYDARPAELDVARDPRTIALSLGSVQLLERLGAWDAKAAQPIVEVRISQQPPTARLFGHDVELRIRARRDTSDVTSAAFIGAYSEAALEQLDRIVRERVNRR